MFLPLLLSALLALIFIIDWIPQFNTWQSRIKIGRYPDSLIWENKVKNTAVKWLDKTPIIKLTDNKRLIIIDIIRGNYKKTAIQHWQQAALILGLSQNFYKTNDENSKKAIDKFINQVIDKSGNWKQEPKEIDSVILAYSFLNCNWLNHSNLKSVYDSCYQIIQDLKGADGTIAYRKHNPNYRYVDTIGFICPFLVKYGNQFDNKEALNLAVKQITTYSQFGMLHSTKIPCHTYNFKNNLPSGLFGWGRGLGWYAIGLIDSWISLPNENQNKCVLTNEVIAFANVAIEFQNANGGWNWQILNTQSQTDSSTTATLAWFLSNVNEIPEINLKATIAKNKHQYF